MRNIEKEINFSIEGMTTIELEDVVNEKSKSSEAIRQLVERNQISYVTEFFSGVISTNGKYMNGARLIDLFILYYVDYYIKKHIADKVLKIERYLNIAILNLHRNKKISKATEDKHRTFGDKVKFLRKDLSHDERMLVLEYFNRVHETSFISVDEFVLGIRKMKSLRDFTLHHYSLLSYKYALMIDNGKRHTEKDGPKYTLRDTMETLNMFITRKSSLSLVKKVRKEWCKYDHSTIEIKNKVKKFIEESMAFDVLNSNKRDVLHFSVIDLITNTYVHVKK